MNCDPIVQGLWEAGHDVHRFFEIAREDMR